MEQDPAEDLWRVLLETRLAFPMSSYFSWDGRFSTALLRLSTEAEAHALVQSGLGKVLPVIYENDALTQAPDAIRAVIDGLGGIRPGQHLHTYTVGEDTIVYAAWWPWQDGSSVSVRIGTFALTEAKVHGNAALAMVKNIFTKNQI